MCKLGKKKEISEREFIRILQDNGYKYVSQKGDHKKFKRDNSTVVINRKLNMVVARRIAKENNFTF